MFVALQHAASVGGQTAIKNPVALMRVARVGSAPAVVLALRALHHALHRRRTLVVKQVFEVTAVTTTSVAPLVAGSVEGVAAKADLAEPARVAQVRSAPADFRVPKARHHALHRVQIFIAQQGFAVKALTTMFAARLVAASAEGFIAISNQAAKTNVAVV
mmetsp:Transcript_42790/g.118196  ORF Transcript_42790/g.118196 Transcript_42790/m.118196 type:complete len:160 (+) Transcript_42790:164-643(+)